jgi:hypothetical protein
MISFGKLITSSVNNNSFPVTRHQSSVSCYRVCHQSAGISHQMSVHNHLSPVIGQCNIHHIHQSFVIGCQSSVIPHRCVGLSMCWCVDDCGMSSVCHRHEKWKHWCIFSTFFDIFSWMSVINRQSSIISHQSSVLSQPVLCHRRQSSINH